MKVSGQWRVVIRHGIITPRPILQIRPWLVVQQRLGTFSAIHRGIHRSGADRLERKHARITRKKTSEAEQDSGPPSRRKRFHDPDSSFGKKSLVYRLKFGHPKTGAQSDQDIQDAIASKPRELGPGRGRPVRQHGPRATRNPREDASPPRRNSRAASGQSSWLTEESGAERPWVARRQGLRAARTPAEDASPPRRQSRTASRQSSWRTEESGAERPWVARRQGPRAARTPGEDASPPRRNSRTTSGQSSWSAEERGADGPWLSRRQGPRSTRTRADDAPESRRSSRTAASDPSYEPIEARDADRSRDRERTVRRAPSLSVPFTTAASQFLYGASVVRGALEAQRRKLYKLYLAEGSKNEFGALRSRAIGLGVPVEVLAKEDQSKMDKMSMGRPHNGVVLEASPLPQPPIAALGACEAAGFHFTPAWQSKEDRAVNGIDSFWPVKTRYNRKPLVLLLHEIVDPGNLGSILRTARFLGVSAVGITTHASTTLTAVVLKAAAGASEELRVFSVGSPADFLRESAKAGWVSYAASPADRPRGGARYLTTAAIVRDNPLKQAPAILVLGNEGHGLPTSLIRTADHSVSIPSLVPDTVVDSLNVSVAAGLLCNAFLQGVDTASRHAAPDASAQPPGTSPRQAALEELDGLAAAEPDAEVEPEAEQEGNEAGQGKESDKPSLW